MRIGAIEGPDFSKDLTLEINACGLRGSNRKKNDGCTVIGSQLHNEHGEVQVDFVMNQDDHGIGGRHLIIKYNMDDRKYYMRDLGDGSGTFVRLDRALELKNGFIVSFGYSHMAVNIFKDAGRDQILLKFIDGPKTD